MAKPLKYEGKPAATETLGIRVTATERTLLEEAASDGDFPSVAALGRRLFRDYLKSIGKLTAAS